MSKHLTLDHKREVAGKRRSAPIPSRNPTVRRRTRELAATLGFEPTAGDIYALTRWAHTYEKWRSIGERLDAEGLTTKAGDPRKLLAEWRALSAELRALERDLGLTAASRAQLAGSVGELRRTDLALELARQRAERERTRAGDE